MFKYAIAAHPTEYCGVVYRSKLEACWAKFFSDAGWEFSYESCPLDGWLPDFVLQGADGPILVEVKPFHHEDDFWDHGVVAKIAHAIAKTSYSSVLLLGIGPDRFGALGYLGTKNPEDDSDLYQAEVYASFSGGVSDRFGIETVWPHFDDALGDYVFNWQLLLGSGARGVRPGDHYSRIAYDHACDLWEKATRSKRLKRAPPDSVRSIEERYATAVTAVAEAVTDPHCSCPSCACTTELEVCTAYETSSNEDSHGWEDEDDCHFCGHDLACHRNPGYGV